MSQQRKEMLADALRKYPTWGDAYIAEREAGERARALLLDVEGSLLAYWTDLPETEIERLRVKIRVELGGWEPEHSEPWDDDGGAHECPECGDSWWIAVAGLGRVERMRVALGGRVSWASSGGESDA